MLQIFKNISKYLGKNRLYSIKLDKSEELCTVTNLSMRLFFIAYYIK